MKDWKFYARYVKEHPPYSILNDESVPEGRHEEMQKFKDKHGFEYSDIWNLDYTIASFLLPRMAFFAEKHSSFPCSIDQIDRNGKIINEDKIRTEYQRKLETIVEGLYLYLTTDTNPMTEKQEQTWEDAKKYLMEIFESLWD